MSALNFLDLPNEILRLIAGHVDQDDIFNLRLSCKRLYGVASTLVSTLYVNHCTFPTDLIGIFTESSHIPEEIDFGCTVKFDFDVNQNHVDFLKLFLGIKSLSIDNYPDMVVGFLEHLPKLEQLSIHAGFGHWKALNREGVKVVIDRVKSSHELPPVKGAVEVGMCKHKVCTVELLKEIRFNALVLKSLNLTIKSKDVLEELAQMDLKLQFIYFNLKENIPEAYVMQVLRQQPDLKYLELDWSNEGFCTNNLCNLLGHTLKGLTTLTLHGFRQVEGFSFVNNLPNLKELHLVGDFSGENFDPTHHIGDDLIVNTNLSELRLTWFAGKFCSTCWTKITTAFPNIVNLTLADLKLDKEICQVIFGNFKLSELQIIECETDGTDFRYSLESQTQLHTLCVLDFPIFDLPETETLHAIKTDSLAIVDVLAENCPELRSLTLTVRCHSKILTKLSKAFPKLDDLDLHLSNVKAVDWKLLYRFKQLRYLELEECKIDAGRMKSLFENIPTLVHLSTKNFDVNKYNYEEKYEKIWKKTVKKVFGKRLQVSN